MSGSEEGDNDNGDSPRTGGNVLLGCYCYGGGDKAEELPIRMTRQQRSARRDTICGMGGVSGGGTADRRCSAGMGVGMSEYS